MTDTSHTPTTALTTTTNRRNRWTRRRQATFLRALACSHSVKKAAHAAGMSRQSAYELRARLKGEPFDLAWHAALRCRFDALADAAMDRAMNGVEVPHFYKGELIGTSRRYDERLTVALLALRERLAPPRSGHHLAGSYDASAFGRLVERVEDGPETWDEQHRIELEALNAELDAAAEEKAQNGEKSADSSADSAFSWP